MNNYSAILPGTSVRADDGVIGTVERLEATSDADSAQPDHMIVRSEDERWRYRIPLMLVRTVSQQAFHPVIELDIAPDELANYVSEQMDGFSERAPLPDGEWTPREGDETLRIPLVSEELIPRKHAVQLGNVHVHRGVETVPQSIDVQLYHEEAVIERIPPDQYDADAPRNPNEVIIPITEEQLVVEKRTVVKEYLRVRKDVVAETRKVRDTVRREYVELTEQRPDGADESKPLVRWDEAPSSSTPSPPR